MPSLPGLCLSQTRCIKSQSFRGGRALGVTMQLPEEDRYAYDRIYLMSRIAVLFGGRIAEELFMNQMTTVLPTTFLSARPKWRVTW